MTTNTAERLEYLRGELRAERMSWGDLAELQSLAPLIPADDLELREAAGCEEFPEEPEECVHDFGPFEFTRFGGACVRRCQNPGCHATTLDGEDDE